MDWKFPFGVLHLQASSAMSDRGDILKLYSIAWIEIRKEKCWCGSICRFSSIYSFIEDFRFDRREKIITKMKRKSPKWQFLHKTKRRRNWKFEFFTFVVVWFALFASGSIVIIIYLSTCVAWSSKIAGKSMGKQMKSFSISTTCIGHKCSHDFHPHTRRLLLAHHRHLALNVQRV